MDNNYFNPGSARPTDLGVPGLAGLQNWYDRQMYDRLMSLQEQHMGDLNETYRLDAPVRAAERPAKISGFDLQSAMSRAKNTPENIQTMVGGELGEARTKAAQGYIAERTRESDADVKNYENLGKQMDYAADQMERMGALNPAMGQSEWRNFRSTLPKQVQAQLPENYSPEVPQLLRNYSKAVVNSVAHQRASALQSQKDTEAYRRTDRTAQASEYGADKRLEAAWARAGGNATKEKVESIIYKSLNKLFNNEELNEQEQRAFMLAQQIQMNVRAAAGIPSDPNALRYDLLFNRQPPPRPTPKPVSAGPKPDDIQKQIESMGETYEPEVYEYKVENGKVFKKPKAKK